MLGRHPSPAAVEQRLKATARDLGAPGWDPIYGYGTNAKGYYVPTNTGFWRRSRARSSVVKITADPESHG